MRKALLSDVFVIGTNAVTMDGKLINIDGNGNRVSAMIFGPDKVIIVVGANKIVNNLEDGLRRIRDIAAPINVAKIVAQILKRMVVKNPCKRIFGTQFPISVS